MKIRIMDHQFFILMFANGNIQPTSLTESGVREKLSLFDENYY